MEKIIEPIPFTDEDDFIPGLQTYGYCEDSVSEIKLINDEIKAFDKDGKEMTIYRVH